MSDSLVVQAHRVTALGKQGMCLVHCCDSLTENSAWCVVDLQFVFVKQGKWHKSSP